MAANNARNAARSDLQMRGHGNRCGPIAWVGVLVAVSNGLAHTQAGWPLQEHWEERCQAPPSPGCTGQWTGPYDLERQITTIDPATGVDYVPAYSDIAHATVLPPGLAGIGNAGKVIFFVEAGTQGPYSALQNFKARTYLWDPSTPSNVTTILPNTDPREDMFCSGHDLDRDGNLVVVGGISLASPPAAFDGVRAIRELDVSASPPTWSIVGSAFPGVSGSLLEIGLYYPTLTVGPDGRPHAIGHVGPLVAGPSGFDQQKIRQTLSASTAGWSGTDVNRWMVLGSTDCAGSDSAVPITLVDYLKIHVMYHPRMMMVVEAPGAELPTSGVLRSWFLPADPGDPSVQAYKCTSAPEWRWLRGPDVPAPGAGFAGGNSAHLITRDGAAVTETIYLLAGTVYTLENAECPSFAHGEVEKVKFLSSSTWQTTSWSGSGPPDPTPALNWTRVNCNTVILLDGSLLVVGGAGVEAGNCVARKTPELYRPPEVFGIPETHPDNVWLPLTDQQHVRSYHSVAGLLPDGRVFSAGGRGTTPGSPDNDKSVEIFSPPYLYWGARPEITTALPTNAHYGASLLIDVATTKDIDRLALLRPCSVTHAVDFGQRYVELPMSGPSFGGGIWSATVTWPDNAHAAPPGWYMLVAVDVEGVPSVGKWMHID